MGWTVKLGTVFLLLMEYASARVLAAFQHEARRAELIDVIARHNRIQAAMVAAAMTAIVAAGGDFSSTELNLGVTSLSYPVLDPCGRAAAALTVPLLRRRFVRIAVCCGKGGGRSAPRHGSVDAERKSKLG